MSRLPFLALGLLVAAAWCCSVNAPAAEVTPASDRTLTPALSQGEREKSERALTPAGTQGAKEKTEPIDRRFASKPEEVPDFRRHVVPLFGRSGCNGRACHGSFQGQGGFRLSLFGYDFKADHEALLESKPPRADLAKPAESLMLQKPTLQVDHEGKQRFKKNSWQYHVILRWIEAGAKPVAKDSAELKSLSVTPAEIVFVKPGETCQLHVVAHWSDGSKEEVTPICRFQTNDDQVAKVSEDGLVTGLEKGDTHAIVFYDNGVAAVPVLLPVSDSTGSRYPAVATNTKIDKLVVDKLRKMGIVPADKADDAEFLRRATLDITGTLPTPTDVEKFLNDSTSDKRKRKIDELLERPGYAAWWATKFCDLTGDSSTVLQPSQPAFGAADSATIANQWYGWIEARLKENTPYDEFAAGLILATSREPGQSYEDYCAAATAGLKEGSDAFTKRATMPYYWGRSNFRKPEDMALGFSHTFMGVRLQCARCHKHPFDQWSKQDFEQFTSFFTRISVGYAPGDKPRFDKIVDELGLKAKGADAKKIAADAIAKGKALPWQEVYVNAAQNAKAIDVAGKRIAGAGAKLPGGGEVDLSQVADPRQVLLDWLRKEPNRYFARSIVNRVWASYFNVGIVEPADDLSLANPASNGPLLDYLTQAFVDQKYDLKWLQREIANSDTYQRQWRVNDTNRLDNHNFSHAVLRRMPAEVAYDALVQATGNDAVLAAMQQKMAVRAIGSIPADRRKGRQKDESGYVLSVFGKPARTVNCDCERSGEATLLQTIFLRNDADTLALLQRDDGWIKQISTPDKKSAATKQSRDGLVRAAYLRTLDRPPTTAELLRSNQYLAAAANPTDGMRDLMWALVNTKEFIVIH